MSNKLTEKCRLTDGEIRQALQTRPKITDMQSLIDNLQFVAETQLTKAIPIIWAGERMLLKKAVELIKIWHNGEAEMKLGHEKAVFMWNVYYNNSPEMKEIREALKEVKYEHTT